MLHSFTTLHNSWLEKDHSVLKLTSNSVYNLSYCLRLQSKQYKKSVWSQFKQYFLKTILITVKFACSLYLSVFPWDGSLGYINQHVQVWINREGVRKGNQKYDQWWSYVAHDLMWQSLIRAAAKYMTVLICSL